MKDLVYYNISNEFLTNSPTQKKALVVRCVMKELHKSIDTN